MTRLKKIFLFSLFAFIFYQISTISRAFAADAYVLEMPLGGGSSAGGPAEYIRLFFIYGLGLVGIVALFAFTFGGVRYMLSGGSDAGVSEGKKWMFGALAGIVLLLSSYLILNTINPALVTLKEPHLDIIYIEKTADNFIPSEVGYQKPIIGTISSTMQNISQYQGQLNSSNSMIIIDKSDHAMYIYKDGQLIAQAPVGIGTSDQAGTQIGGASGDKITPVGDFVVTSDKKYSANGVYSGQYGSNMGPAFIGLSCTDQNGGYRGIGIHGSNDDSLRPTYGCVRTQNADVVAIYQNIQSGTPVKIRN